MGSPIKGRVPPKWRRAGKEKKHLSLRKNTYFFTCPLTFAPAQPRFCLLFRIRYFYFFGSWPAYSCWSTPVTHSDQGWCALGRMLKARSQVRLTDPRKSSVPLQRRAGTPCPIVYFSYFVVFNQPWYRFTTWADQTSKTIALWHYGWLQQIPITSVDFIPTLIPVHCCNQDG